jgi:hypothetical protein
VRRACPRPWMLCGDFNLIYRDEDKNNSNLDWRMMGRFYHCINALALKEVYLNRRCYTWTNGQTPPTLVLLDRVLCTSDWEEIASECHLRCLTSMVFDHNLLMLDCSPMMSTHHHFHFEDYWLHLVGFQDTVSMAWLSVNDADPLCA